MSKVSLPAAARACGIPARTLRHHLTTDPTLAARLGGERTEGGHWRLDPDAVASWWAQHCPPGACTTADIAEREGLSVRRVQQCLQAGKAMATRAPGGRRWFAIVKGKLGRKPAYVPASNWARQGEPIGDAADRWIAEELERRRRAA